MIQQRISCFFSRLAMPAALLCLLSISLVIAGCAGGLAPFSQTTTPPATPTVSVAATPASVTAGTSVTLTITAANASQITVTGTDGSSFTMTGNGGTKVVTPTTTTTYTVTVTGGSTTVTATTTVTVVPPGPPTVTITAAPTSINIGDSSILTVTANNATQVTIAGTDGKSYPLSSTGGTQVVTPTVTTTYNATATGLGGTISASVIVNVTPSKITTVTIEANPATIVAGNASQLTVTATNATQNVLISGTDGSSYSLSPTGGTQTVKPTGDTTYTATATGATSTVSATASVTVTPAGTVKSIDHVIFMLQENHSFDNYFGMLNAYRATAGGPTADWTKGDDGNTYTVDGLDTTASPVSNSDDGGDVYTPFKFKSTCVDDMSSAWLASYGDVNRYDFSSTRQILMDGFVHNAEGYATSCAANPKQCSGDFTDTTGQRAMGYYDQGFLNYYYYMATQFALSDRWFSPVASKSVDNRIATFSGGTTQGLVKDPGNDGYGQLPIKTIFEELDDAKVSWKIYYTVTQGFCFDTDECTGGASDYPATDFSNFSYSYKYIYQNPNGAPCSGGTQAGGSNNDYCVDPTHIAPLSQYYTDLANNTLPSFAFIEAGYGQDDEHPGSGQTILYGQSEVANIINKFMASSSWNDSVFFLSYDEGGGPYDHVPPVPNSSNINTSTTLLSSTTAADTYTDISSIAVNPDKYNPCVPQSGTTSPTLPPYCDLTSTDPGATSTDAAAMQGFAAQLGFRVPNMVISPFTRKHYVSHISMDHTAIIRFVEDRFIGNSTYLTNRDAAQPTLLDFFDFNNVPWATPPTPPAPFTDSGASCTPTSM